MHVTDVMPTILALAGVPQLAQHDGAAGARRMDGLDCAAVLTEDAPSPRTEQYYECWSNRAYFRDGWLARSLQVRGQPIDMDNWTLHDLDEDFSESTDVAQRRPSKLAELVAAFDAAAWANDVYPLDNRRLMGKLVGRSARACARSPTAPRRSSVAACRRAPRATSLPPWRTARFACASRCDQRAGDQGVLWALGDFIARHGVVRRERASCTCTTTASAISSTCRAGGPAAGRASRAARVRSAGWAARPRTAGFRRWRRGRAGSTCRRRSCSDRSRASTSDSTAARPVSWDVRERHGTFAYSGTIDDVWIEPGPRAAAGPKRLKGIDAMATPSRRNVVMAARRRCRRRRRRVAAWAEDAGSAIPPGRCA